MAFIKAFKGIRPNTEVVEKVSCLPYDVMNREEAKDMAKDNPYSFLHVVRSEIDFNDDVSQYDDRVYKRARENLDKMIQKGILEQESTESIYIYRQIMKDKVQTGIVGCTSIDDYMNDIIRKHEFTRPEKEEDRIKNFDYCNANTAPIFLTYRKNDHINNIVNNWIDAHNPIFDFTTEDGITHMVWNIYREEVIKDIIDIFKGINYLYIADGHHRSASAVKVGLKRREQNKDFTGEEEFNYFLSVLFPDEDLYIMDYNRVVKDLNGNTEKEFLNKIAKNFIIEEVKGNDPYKPTEKHTFGMYLTGKWYKIIAKEGIFDKNHPVERLDVSILQKNILNPILGIDDPRTNKRIDFIGGIRGMGELEKRVNTDMKVAFSVYPTTVEDLIDIADEGMIMPPKSTWFEPKLRSGLFVHRL
ncbi:DUF1015 domain-containing protein [Clostridiisalibacter paucivorans]|uniref:DUF1015 domain-containing protein n=1 Tax=Clostridiisalibacter paucivorans TaxID=408753 RepID=UPI00047D11DF|nr:DUF1015 family protein [Clostridiisalibacter paucivorans]